MGQIVIKNVWTDTARSMNIGHTLLFVYDYIRGNERKRRGNKASLKNVLFLLGLD